MINQVYGQVVSRGCHLHWFQQGLQHTPVSLILSQMLGSGLVPHPVGELPGWVVGLRAGGYWFGSAWRPVPHGMPHMLAALGTVLFNISSGELGRSQRELCQICRWIQGCGAGVDSAWSGGSFRVLWEAQGQHSAWLRLRNCFCFSKTINKP